MKKRFLIAATVACMLAAGFVTGCGSKTADAPTTAATEAVVEIDYMTWSGKEWNAADDTEKAAAAKLYLIETAKAAAKVADQEFTSEMEASITDEDVNTVIESLESAFVADESITIQQLLDASVAVMDSMLETAAE